MTAAGKLLLLHIMMIAYHVSCHIYVMSCHATKKLHMVFDMIGREAGAGWMENCKRHRLFDMAWQEHVAPTRKQKLSRI